MRGKLFWISAVAFLAFASQALALDSGIDCAEGSDEDLAAETQTVEPTVPSTTPFSSTLAALDRLDPQLPTVQLIGRTFEDDPDKTFAPGSF